MTVDKQIIARGGATLENSIRSSSLIQLIGNTPLVRLGGISNEIGHNVFAKLEYMNPSGSVKDRMALYIIERAEREGLISPGCRLIDNSSGNTAVSVAMIAAIKGYGALFTVPDKTSQEKIDLIKSLGAEIVICPTDVAADDPRSYYSTARRLADESGAFLINQYHNPWNIESYAATLGPEIWEQTGGTVDVFVAGIGTGGTLSGTARYLKSQHPDVIVVAVDPVGSVFHSLFHENKLSDPGRYLVEGIGSDTQTGALDMSVIDDLVQIDDREAFTVARRLVREEGLIAGGSSGSAVAGVRKWSRSHDSPLNIVTILPDSGLRYVSKFLNDDWLREAGLMPES